MKILGTGIDIIEVDRIAKAIKKWGDGFLCHVFTDTEIIYAKKHKFPYEHFAARFAAKEAVFKALGDQKRVQWKDIQIINDKDGRPVCLFKRPTHKGKIFISLSHTKKYAVANAIITS